MNMNDTLNSWLPFLQKEAELGNPDAMSILSRLHRDGIGVPKDKKLANHYAKLEANSPPFTLDDDDDSNPWANPSVEV